MAVFVAMTMPTFASTVTQNGITLKTYSDASFTQEINTYQWFSGGSIYVRATNTNDIKEVLNLSTLFGIASGVKVTGIYEWKDWINTTNWNTICNPYNAMVNGTNVTFNNCTQIANGSYMAWGWKSTNMNEYISSQKEWRTFGMNIGKNSYKDFRIDVSIPINSNGKFDIKTYNSDNSQTLLDPWWNSSWTKKAVIYTTSNTILTDYQLAVNVTYDSDMSANFSDLRFTNASETTELSYWIQTKVNSAWAYVWIKGNLTSVGNQTFAYMYYGNPSVTNASSITTTMIFGDDFDDSSINWTRWTNATGGTASTLTENNGYFNLSQAIASASYTLVWSTASINISRPAIWETYLKISQTNNSAGANYRYMGMRNTNPATGNPMVADVIETEYTDTTTPDSMVDGTANNGVSTTNTTYDFPLTDNIIKIKWASDKVAVYYNNVLHSNLTSNIADENIRPEMMVATSGALPNTAFWSAYDWVFVRQYTSTEPSQITFGAEQSFGIINISINSPANTTYWTASNTLFNFTATSTQNSTFNLNAYLDGNVLFSTTSYSNNTVIAFYENLSQAKTYNFTVYAQDGTLNITSTIFFAIEDYEITSTNYTSVVNETQSYNFSITYHINPDLVPNITSYLYWNNTNYGTQNTSVNNGTHIINTKLVTIPLITTNNSAINHYWNSTVTLNNYTSTYLYYYYNYTFCYQETANVSTICGGLATGNYAFAGGTWINLTNTYDGNWSTYGAVTNWNDYGNIYINYTKPVDTSIISLWQVHDYASADTTVNLTIPQSCWNYNTSTLMLRTVSGISHFVFSIPFVEWDCYDGSWVLLRYSSGYSSGKNYIYEEAMWWGKATAIATINRTFANYYNETNISSTNPQNVTWSYWINSLSESPDPMSEDSTTNLTQNIFNTLKVATTYVNVTFNSSIYQATFLTNTSTNETWYKSITIGLINASQVNYTYNATLYVSYGGNTFLRQSQIGNFTVIAMNLSTCGVNATRAFNFTFYREETDLPTNEIAIDANNFEATFIVYKNGSSLNRNYTFKLNGSNYYEICISPNFTTFLTDAHIRYFNTSYSTRNYFLENYTVDNKTDNISLYLLETTLSSPISFEIRESNGINPAASVVIQALRFYPDENVYRIVAMALTDGDGKGFSYLKMNTVFHKFKLYRDGEFKREIEQGVLGGADVAAGLTLTYSLTVTSLAEIMEIYEQVVGSCTSNNATAIVTCTYADSSTHLQTMYLTVQRLSNVSWTAICTNSSITDNGTLTCDASGGGNGTYYYWLYGKFASSSLLTIKIADGSFYVGQLNIFGTAGLLFSAILIIALVMIGSFNPIVTIFMGITGLVASSILGMLDISLAALVGIIIVGIIIAIKSRG